MNDKINILLVDDLPDNLLVLQTILEELGEQIVTARSGQDALRQVLERDFAVILLDVNMPGMDGYETAALIRKRRKSAHTPIIFVTAYADELHKAQGYSLGAVDFILAPVVPDVLRTKVKVFVDLFRMTEMARRQADEQVALAHEQAARTAAEDTVRRLNFLAQASKVLADSLDMEETLRGLLRLVVSHLADLSAISLVDEQGRIGPTEFAWNDPTLGIQARSLPDPRQLDHELIRAFQRVLTGRRPDYAPALSQLSAARLWCLPDSGATSAPTFEFQSIAMLPLVARNRALGILTLATDNSGRGYGPADRALAEELAGRAAVAIDNARLYGNIQDADHRKNEFMSMLAHELRNPLAPILNGVQLLGLGSLDQPEHQQVREMIERQVHHLVRLVDDLLDVSRITQGKIRLQRTPVAVAAIVARAVELSRPLIEARRHELIVTMPQESVRVDADAVRLTQVLTNLLNNAAKYTEEGGKVWLTVARQDHEALITVRDNGLGIPVDMLSSVFELFTQVERSSDRSQGGLGIGLTLVRRLVEMHGGSVTAASPGLNQGSEFTVRLPALADAPARLPATLAGLPGKTVAHRVLVVDDHRDVANGLAMLLREIGQEVETAHDGLAALTMAQTFRPDIVLLDIGLPDMDGYEVAGRLRQQITQRKVTLVALTGYGQEDDLRRSREAGFDHHLVKPAKLAQLTALFARRILRPLTSRKIPLQHDVAQGLQCRYATLIPRILSETIMLRCASCGVALSSAETDATVCPACGQPLNLATGSMTGLPAVKPRAKQAELAPAPPEKSLLPVISLVISVIALAVSIAAIAMVKFQ